MEKVKKELADSHANTQSANTKLLFKIGDEIAKANKYKTLSGLDAVYYFLVNKHNWLPSQVKAFNTEDLLFCLSEEDFSTFFKDSDSK